MSNWPENKGGWYGVVVENDIEVVFEIIVRTNL